LDNAIFTEKRKLIANCAPPSVGKTYYITSYIKRRLKENKSLKFIYFTPVHDTTEGFKNLEENCKKEKISFFHIFGKSQYKVDKSGNVRTESYENVGCFCDRPEKERGFPGCGFSASINKRKLSELQSKYAYTYVRSSKRYECPMREICAYKQQFKEEGFRESSLLIAPIEYIYLSKQREVIIDESYLNKIIIRAKIGLSKEEIEQYHINLLDEIPTEEGHGVNIKYFNANLNDLDENYYDYKSYVLCNFKESTSSQIMFKQGELYYIIGRSCQFPTEFERILFNDATGSARLCSLLTNTNEEEWTEFRALEEISNETIFSSLNYTMKYSVDSLEWFKEMVEEIMSNIDGKICIITKKNIKDNLIELPQDFYNRIEFVTYGQSRGSNMWDKDYELVLAYCQYALDPKTCFEYKLFGFKDEDIDDLEISEMKQALHRPRPLKHPNTPYLLMIPNKMGDKMNIKNYRVLPADSFPHWTHCWDRSKEGMKSYFLDQQLNAYISRGVVSLNRFIVENVFKSSINIKVKTLLKCGVSVKNISEVLQLSPKSIYKIKEKLLKKQIL
jgi:hypothetical protein